MILEVIKGCWKEVTIWLMFSALIGYLLTPIAKSDTFVTNYETRIIGNHKYIIVASNTCLAIVHSQDCADNDFENSIKNWDNSKRIK